MRRSVNVLPELSGTFGFDLADLTLEPFLDRVYRQRLVAFRLKVLERLPCVIKGNRMTRNRLRVILRTNEIK